MGLGILDTVWFPLCSCHISNGERTPFWLYLKDKHYLRGTTVQRWKSTLIQDVSQQPLVGWIPPEKGIMFLVERSQNTYTFLALNYLGSRVSKRNNVYCIPYPRARVTSWPFAIQVPLAPCLSQSTVAKVIISSCKGNWNHLLLWEFLSSFSNVGCVAGGTGELLLVLAFVFNLGSVWWKQNMMAKVQRCVP